MAMIITCRNVHTMRFKSQLAYEARSVSNYCCRQAYGFFVRVNKYKGTERRNWKIEEGGYQYINQRRRGFKGVGKEVELNSVM